MEDYAILIPHEQLRFFWVDERCVAPTHAASNYGVAEELLLKPLHIPATHIHRILGEGTPREEAVQYSSLVKSLLPDEHGVPIFDFVFLGMGGDGHTSSIFPQDEASLLAREPYVATVNPYDGVHRVGMSALPMQAALHTCFFVTGENKKAILQRVIDDKEPYRYPASHVLHKAKNAPVFAAV